MGLVVVVVMVVLGRRSARGGRIRLRNRGMVVCWAWMGMRMGWSEFGDSIWMDGRMKEWMGG
jgi:hypothetical protein